MKTDLYTKTILTVIAIFLGVLIFQNTSVYQPYKQILLQPPKPLNLLLHKLHLWM